MEFRVSQYLTPTNLNDGESARGIFPRAQSSNSAIPRSGPDTNGSLLVSLSRSLPRDYSSDKCCTQIKNDARPNRKRNVPISAYAKLFPVFPAWSGKQSSIPKQKRERRLSSAITSRRCLDIRRKSGSRNPLVSDCE